MSIVSKNEFCLKELFLGGQEIKIWVLKKIIKHIWFHPGPYIVSGKVILYVYLWI